MNRKIHLMYGFFGDFINVTFVIWSRTQFEVFSSTTMFNKKSRHRHCENDKNAERKENIASIDSRRRSLISKIRVQSLLVVRKIK